MPRFTATFLPHPDSVGDAVNQLIHAEITYTATNYADADQVAYAVADKLGASLDSLYETADR
jgi:hypothetical protein